MGRAASESEIASLPAVAERLERVGMIAEAELVRALGGEISRLRNEVAIRTRVVNDQARTLDLLRRERDDRAHRPEPPPNEPAPDGAAHDSEPKAAHAP